MDFDSRCHWQLRKPEPGPRSLPRASSYGPLYFASAVLPDGRYIIEGGEYNNGNDAWTKLGAIYDPVANTWTSVTPPSRMELDRRRRLLPF